MIKVLFFSLSALVPTASACAALVRASGHKARAVDATLLTKADREAADVVITHVESEDIVRAAYGDDKVLVCGEFIPVQFMPESMAAIEAWIRGEGEKPTFDPAPAASPVDPEAHARIEAMKAELTSKGVKFRANATEAKLKELLTASAPSA